MPILEIRQPWLEEVNYPAQNYTVFKLNVLLNRYLEKYEGKKVRTIDLTFPPLIANK